MIRFIVDFSRAIGAHDFHDSRVERARFSTARGREDDDVMCARVSPHAGPLEDAHADAREDWLECARAPAIRANSSIRARNLHSTGGRLDSTRTKD